MMGAMIFDRVVGAVAEAKGGHPLASATVVVPNHAAGRDVLHALARAGPCQHEHRDGGADCGAVGGAGPLTSAGVAVSAARAAVARVLDERPGVFKEVAEAPITAQALAQASWQLTELAEPRIENPTPLVDDLLRIHREALDDELTGRYFLKT